MIAKLFATEDSTETGLAHFTFETTFEEAEKLGSFTGDDEFFIVKADKYIGTLLGCVEELESTREKVAACVSDEVFQVFAGTNKGDKVEMVCIASD